MTAYSQRLKDPRWQKKRLEIMERDGFKCIECGDDQSELQVHHRKYVKDADPWDINSEYLICLCKECHEDTTRFTQILFGIIRFCAHSDEFKDIILNATTKGKQKKWSEVSKRSNRGSKNEQ